MISEEEIGLTGFATEARRFFRNREFAAETRRKAKDLTERAQRKGGEHRESGRDPSSALAGSG
jgi:hypothetical protein